ncbi:MAG: cobalamin-binding protein [Firmicutes bacterium]|jgi:iron complex transport system substrate-binding protein|nr:cobalamin-binding protein [Bacillota bacterium]
MVVGRPRRSSRAIFVGGRSRGTAACALLLLFGSVLLCGCLPRRPERQAVSGAENRSEFPVTLTDATGREVSLSAKPLRVVSIAPTATEVVCALGAGDRLVGVTTFCNYPAEVAQKEKVGDYSNPSIEKIASLKPDIVVGDFVHTELASRLGGLGIPSLLLNSRGVSDAVSAVRLVGRALGESEAAESVSRAMESRVRRITDKLAAASDRSRPTVFHLMWHEPIMTSGPGTIMDDLIALAGGVNVAADAKTLYPEYSLEALFAKDPDVIVYTIHSAPLEIALKGWTRLRAVKEGRVFLLTDDLVSRAGPRIVDGLEELARALHPSLFE